MSSCQKILKIWIIPESELKERSQNVFFYISEDLQFWGGDYDKLFNPPKEGEMIGWSLKINTKHSVSYWEEVRLYAIKYLLPQLELPKPPPEPYFRFKNLDL